MVDVDDIMEDAEVVQPASPEKPSPEPQQVEEMQSTPKSQRVSQETITLADRSVERETRVSDRDMEIERAPSPTKTVPMNIDTNVNPETVPASSPVQLLGTDSPAKSPAKPSRHVSPALERKKPELPPPTDHVAPEPTDQVDDADENEADVTRSPSEGSSPIRPLVRKSSLSFASLPAREPLTSKKSLGTRMSRVSHVDQTRTSFYSRLTGGGKSLGVRQDALEDQDAMDVDEDDHTDGEEEQDALTNHSKTYTQRLQDQISMLGKSQAAAPRPKSIPNLTAAQPPSLGTQSQIPQQAQPTPEDQSKSPKPTLQLTRTPGAFPNDDDDDWIAPPTTKQMPPQSPRLGLAKSLSADVMEGLSGKGTAGTVDFEIPHAPSPVVRHQSPIDSPRRVPPPAQRSAALPGDTKTISGPDFSRISTTENTLENDLVKSTAFSHQSIDVVRDADLPEAPLSPQSTVRDSPVKSNALKHVKNKFSSILKGSKGLLASSAALSAEGKASLANSPSTTALRKVDTEASAAEPPVTEQEIEPLYPDLTKHLSPEAQPTARASSPTTTNNRKTRASIERERREQKQKDKEEKEAQHRADQREKLEKAREKERERAREIATERQIAAQKESDKNTRTPVPKDARKAKAQTEADGGAATEELGQDRVDMDVEMAEQPTNKAAPPSIPRPTAGQTLKSRDIKRPIKPTKDASVRLKQAPTLIRVNTSSQNTGFHPSNSILSTTLQDTLGGSEQQTKSRPGQASLQSKPSLQSLKSSVSSTSGRPKALELAAKRKQQEEKEQQRRRDLKAEMERKREEDRRQEEERREKERQKAVAEAEAKKIAEKQLAIEKAKQTRAPPPAVRSQPNGPPQYNTVREKATMSRPQSRMQQAMAHRSQEDLSRPVGASKMPSKRPLQQDGADDDSQRPAPPRAGLPQQKEVKRMRLSDEFNLEEEMEIQSYGTNLKGPPVRPSAGFKKVSPSLAIPTLNGPCLQDMQDLPNKALFFSGYAPAPQSVTKDIFKAPVAPHNTKSGHPLDMAQVSKGHINFASSQHGAHKTPARPAGVMAAKSAAKSTTRASPRFQNGDNIELPEIETDDEDDEDETRALGQASWADTPALRRELMKQETIDPLQVFGPPAPLKLEEVFKNKDRWSKFRARTSSANWSGTDRLTEDEIRKDIAAREKMRRDGGWSYELSKDMA